MLLLNSLLEPLEPLEPNRYKGVIEILERFSEALGLYRPWGVVGTERRGGGGIAREARRCRGIAEGMPGEGVPARAFPSPFSPAMAQGRRKAPDAPRPPIRPSVPPAGRFPCPPCSRGAPVFFLYAAGARKN